MASSGRRVVCVGLICMDLVSVCKEFPQEDTDQRVDSLHWKRGGNASTSSVVLSLLGTQVDFVGVVPNSSDCNNTSWGVSAAKLAINDLKKHGVGVDHIAAVSSEDFPTSMVMVNAQNGSRTIMHYRGNLPELSADDLMRLDPNRFDWFHFESRPNINVISSAIKRIKDQAKEVTVSMELEKVATYKADPTLQFAKHADLVFVSKEFASNMKCESAVEAVEHIHTLLPRVRSQYWQRGGNAGNIAEVLSHLGTRAEFYGTFPDISKMAPTIIGGAAAAKFCLSELDRAGVEHSHIAIRDCPDFPSSSIILSEETGTRTITHYRGPLDELTIADFSVINLNDYCWVHFEGRSNIEAIKSAVNMIDNNNSSCPAGERTKISLELEIEGHDGLLDVCGLADLVVVSRYFARHRGYNNAKDCVEGLRPLLKPGGEIVCSWGEIGAACCTNATADEAVLVPAMKPEKVIDTLGAGDTFQAALIHAKLLDLSLIECVEFACQVSSRKISSRGYNAVKGMGLTRTIRE